MEILTFILGAAVAVLLVPTGIAARIQKGVRRKLGELIKGSKK